MEMNFCRRCGSKLTNKSGEMYVCENDHTLFSNAAPASSIFFVNDNDEVLLSIRGIEPYKGMLDSPGGFVDIGETLEEAVAREIQEELGLTPDQYEVPQFLCSGVSIYPYDGENRAILGSFFWSRLNPGANPVAADDVASIKFVPISTVDFAQVGNQDVKEGLKKLQALFSK